MGHVRIPHDAAADPFAGACPFHRDCLEGLASGPALQARWGRPAEELPDDHPAWALEAHYLALALANFVCTLSPRRIVLGGGVMDRRALFPMIRARLQALLNDYVQAPEIRRDIDGYVVPPKLGGRTGVLGALALARAAAEPPRPR
jgi:fructokinase